MLVAESPDTHPLVIEPIADGLCVGSCCLRLSDHTAIPPPAPKPKSPDLSMSVYHQGLLVALLRSLYVTSLQGLLLYTRLDVCILRPNLMGSAPLAKALVTSARAL